MLRQEDASFVFVGNGCENPVASTAKCQEIAQALHCIESRTRGHRHTPIGGINVRFEQRQLLMAFPHFPQGLQQEVQGVILLPLCRDGLPINAYAKRL